jgi:hypothetical protein
MEKGRYFGIEREKRTRSLCNQQEIGDEFRYILNVVVS